MTAGLQQLMPGRGQVDTLPGAIAYAARVVTTTPDAPISRAIKQLLIVVAAYQTLDMRQRQLLAACAAREVGDRRHWRLTTTVIRAHLEPAAGVTPPGGST